MTTPKPRPIALLTDFGLEDVYVGVMKACMLEVAPGASLIDLTHHVPPQNLWSGAHLLRSAAPYLPDGAVVMAVVDPGVGTDRRPVAVRGERLTYVAPDNGLLGLALELDPPQEAVVLTDEEFHRRPSSATFHGRDIFAPCAAHLAAGVPLLSLGTEIGPASLARLDLPKPQLEAEWLMAPIAHVDHFGNLITTLDQKTLWRWLVGRSVLKGPRHIPLANTFADVAIGAPVAYIGSGGTLEVAVRNGSAARRFGVTQGGKVILRVAGEEGVVIEIDDVG